MWLACRVILKGSCLVHAPKDFLFEVSLKELQGSANNKNVVFKKAHTKLGLNPERFECCQQEKSASV